MISRVLQSSPDYGVGQTQWDRYARALDPQYVQIDDRTPAEFVALIRRWAANVRYYPSEPQNPTGDWTRFFPQAEDVERYMASSAGTTPPHLALLLAFLQMYKEPQAVLNAVAERHLDYYYKEVLRLSPRPVQPGRAYLVLKLKKGAKPFLITDASRFAAKSRAGLEREATPVGEYRVTQAAVERLHVAFVHPKERTLRIAQLVPPQPGLAVPRNHSFDNPIVSELSRTGFALASPFLRLKEGCRLIRLTIDLDDAETVPSVVDAFEVDFSSPLGWTRAETVVVQNSTESQLSFEITVPTSAPAWVPYNPKRQTEDFRETEPLVRFLLAPSYPGNLYQALAAKRVNAIALEVAVDRIRALSIEGDSGALDSTKPFMPFGAIPVRDSTFRLRCDEVFAKDLAKLALFLRWKGVPENLQAHYDGYGIDGITNDAFQAEISLVDHAGTVLSSWTKPLFVKENARNEQTWDLSPTGETKLFSLGNQSGGRPGFLVVRLLNEYGFLHSAFQRAQIQMMLAAARSEPSAPLLRPLLEPYTPVIETLALSYVAKSQAFSFGQDHSSGAESAEPSSDRFYHLDVMGIRQIVPVAPTNPVVAEQPTVSLLPLHTYPEYFLGLSGVEPSIVKRQHRLV